MVNTTAYVYFNGPKSIKMSPNGYIIYRCANVIYYNAMSFICFIAEYQISVSNLKEDPIVHKIAKIDQFYISFDILYFSTKRNQNRSTIRWQNPRPWISGCPSSIVRFVGKIVQ